MIGNKYEGRAERVAMAWKLRNEGKTIKEIADIVGVNPRIISFYFNDDSWRKHIGIRGGGDSAKAYSTYIDYEINKTEKQIKSFQVKLESLKLIKEENLELVSRNTLKVRE